MLNTAFPENIWHLFDYYLNNGEACSSDQQSKLLCICLQAVPTLARRKRARMCTSSTRTPIAPSGSSTASTRSVQLQLCMLTTTGVVRAELAAVTRATGRVQHRWQAAVERVFAIRVAVEAYRRVASASQRELDVRSLTGDSSLNIATIPALSNVTATYFVHLELAEPTTGTRISRNSYWLSTKTDALDWYLQLHLHLKSLTFDLQVQVQLLPHSVHGVQ